MRTVKTPVRVAVTGAAGQIGYSLLFRIASGAMLGDDQPVILQLLEITPALDALKGVAMELDDCAFPLLAGIVQTDDPNVAFGDVNYALLVGSRPRSKGMERKDLLEANGAIFTVQGKALSDNAAADVRILVVGNPANTNALIAMNNAPGIRPSRFTAMTRLDHNRAMAQLAAKTGTTVNDVTRMTIWGNHSATQYPDLFHAEVNGKNAAELIDDQAWIDGDVPARPSSSAARPSSRPAACRARPRPPTPPSTTCARGCRAPPTDDWVSMAIPSDGSYDVPDGLMSSFPVTTADGEYSIVGGLDIDDYSRGKIDASVAELVEERDTVAELGLI